MNYLRVKQRVAEIARNCGRDPNDILIVTVSKGHLWEETYSAYAAGCRHFGESRIQEALEKIPEAPQDVHWHLIGTLQSNKVSKAIGKFTLIHSIDTFELALKISQASQKAQIATSILLQVNTSGEKAKYGLSAEAWIPHLEKLVELPGIKLEGLMTIAPFVEDQDCIRQCFAKLRDARNEFQKRVEPKAVLKHLSMGMSHDYAIAIAEGATILRIGTAIYSEI